MVVVHLMIKFRFHFLPESIAFVLIGQSHSLPVNLSYKCLIYSSPIHFVSMHILHIGFVIGFVYHYVIRKIGYDLVVSE